MADRIGRTFNAVKNADGTVSCEFFYGTGQGQSTNRVTWTLTSAEVTALSAVLSGGTGTKSSASHTKETTASGECDH